MQLKRLYLQRIQSHCNLSANLNLHPSAYQQLHSTCLPAASNSFHHYSIDRVVHRSSIFYLSLKLRYVIVNVLCTSLKLTNSAIHTDEVWFGPISNFGYLFAATYTWNTHTLNSAVVDQPAPLCHGSLHINCSLYQFNLVLLWARTLHWSPYRQRVSRVYNIIVVCAALLLTAGDTEPNPGPQPHPAIGTIHFG
jgi:hypothetical protein